MREDDTVSVLGMLIPRKKYNTSLLLYGIIFCMAAVGLTTWEFLVDQPKIVAVRSTLSSLARFGFIEAVFFMHTPAHEEDDDVLGIKKENARDH